MEEGGEIGRRGFLAYIAAAIGGLITTVLAVPVLGSLISPALGRSTGAQWVRLGPVGSFAPREPQLVPFYLVRKDGWVETREPKVVWVVRREGEAFSCFNARCTHLGCIVDWSDSGMAGKMGWNFYSPCHGGVFDIQGRVITGPPPRPLDTLSYKVEKGELWVEYQDFRLGIPDKVPL